MDSKPNRDPLIVILGETASGKSELAMYIAQKFNGEIIAADSRTIYKGLDIGTAKPSKIDRQLVKHHLIDVVAPDQSFSAAEFKARATKSIINIESRGKIPILVGGSGLYIDSLIYNFTFLKTGNTKEREILNAMSVHELKQLILNRKLPLPRDDSNPRRLIRTIESNGVQPAKGILRENTLLIGINIDRDELRAKIQVRVDKMFRQGLEEELIKISNQYGWNAPGLQSTGYKALKDYIKGDYSKDDAKDRFVLNDMHLARRQRTWFKRNESIQWTSNRKEVVELVTTFLNK